MSSTYTLSPTSIVTSGNATVTEAAASSLAASTVICPECEETSDGCLPSTVIIYPSTCLSLPSPSPSEPLTGGEIATPIYSVALEESVATRIAFITVTVMVTVTTVATPSYCLLEPTWFSATELLSMDTSWFTTASLETSTMPLLPISITSNIHHLTLTGLSPEITFESMVSSSSCAYCHTESTYSVAHTIISVSSDSEFANSTPLISATRFEEGSVSLRSKATYQHSEYTGGRFYPP